VIGNAQAPGQFQNGNLGTTLKLNLDATLLPCYRCSFLRPVAARLAASAGKEGHGGVTGAESSR
jgi:hypothetical protein